jgi:signal transduction histidine kinase
MAPIRFRTKLALSLTLSTAILTVATLFIVQHYLRSYALREEIPNSLAAFQKIAGQRQEARLRIAAMTADLPRIRSLMTTDKDTIQDVSKDYWSFTGKGLFLLANPSGRVMGFHSINGELEESLAQSALTDTLTSQRRPRDWWFGAGRLYEIFVQEIYSGVPEDDRLLGYLVIGYVVDETDALAFARGIGGHVALRYGDAVAASSLEPHQEQDLAAQRNLAADQVPPEDIVIRDKTYVAQSVVLAPVRNPAVTLTVMKSYDDFLREINMPLIGVGLVVLAAGVALMLLLSHTLTLPLSRLASGVAALEKGDYAYPLSARSHDEVGELVHAFDTMRKSLKESQQHLLHAERLATIGRMASTITHDLRHPLTTILAYAELLSEDKLDEDERRDLYAQIRMSVNNMAELIASLLEFSKAQEALHFEYGDCVETLQDTVRSVKLRPEYSGVQLSLLHEGPTQGWFDFAKLDRVFHNLVRNACEAAPADSGRVRIVAQGADNRVEILVTDNGSGIPEVIRKDIFQPFVTYGKPDGTGLGLAVVEKIVHDHGGAVAVESTGPRGTTFKVTLPVVPPAKRG